MHIAVGDFHPELQHQVPRLRRMAKLMRVPGVIRIIDWLRRREAYVEGLRAAGIDVAHTVYEGCYHAFEYIGEGGEIGAEARGFTFENFGLFYDRYVTETST